jgi:hypothetical protein
LASCIFPVEFIPALAPPLAELVTLEAGVELFLGGAGRAALGKMFEKKQKQTRMNNCQINFGHFSWINQNPQSSKEHNYLQNISTNDDAINFVRKFKRIHGDQKISEPTLN